MRTKVTNVALWASVGYVVGAIPSVWSRVIAVGVTVALVPNTVGVSGSSTCCASSVGMSGGADIVDELPILLQKFINLRLLLVNLGLLFPDHLQQIVILRRHLLDMLFVGSCRYRYFT